MFDTTPSLRAVRGFTLLEILMVVGAISIASAAVIYGISNSTPASKEVKLRRDVATLNCALQAYEMNGGDLTGVTAQAALNLLKRTASAESAKQMAGLTGRMIDNRLMVALQSTVEASTGEMRAYWNPAQRRFELKTSGGQGIKEFVLDESLADHNYGEDLRQSTYLLAKNSGWIWDSENEAPTAAAPAQPGTGAATIADPGDGGEPVKLAPPIFDIASGQYPLKDFPMEINILNANPPGSSEVDYTVDGGGHFGRYASAFLLDPGSVSALAYCRSLDPDRYLDSDPADRSYSVLAAVPEVRLAFTKSSYNYVELGGPLEAGAYSAAARSVSGTVTLANPAEIPAVYQNSSVFVAQWSIDGADPLSSGTAGISPAFANGFPAQAVPVTVDTWGSADSLQVKAAIKSLRPDLVTHSAVEQSPLTINVLTLREPLQSTIDRDVLLALDVDHGDIPLGSYIQYTIDGTDPGNSDGRPVRGMRYTAPVFMDGVMGSQCRILARVYPPEAYRRWFAPSLPMDFTYTLPASTLVYVGGNFYLPGGAAPAMRNVARLNGIGAVDTRFNTGAGASADSLVGVIRQASAGVYTGGDFETMNGIARAGVVRLRSDGSVDTGFDAGLAGIISLP